MSTKVKLISLIMSFISLISLIIVGVFAIKQTDFEVTGNITFKATGVEATIEKTSFNGTLSNGTVDVDKLTPVNLDTSMNATQIVDSFTPWQNLSLNFGADGADVILKFRITNNAESGADNYISSEITVDEGISSNCTITAVNDVDDTNIVIIGPQDYADFTITFSVTDKKVDASISGFAIKFNLEYKKAEQINFPSASDYADVLIFTFNESLKTASVKAANKTITSVVIPAYIKSNNNVICKVLDLTQDAFRSCSSLIDVNIPNTVRNIGGYAFSGCSKLTSIKVPSSVKSIGSFAFQSCPELARMKVAEGNSVYEDRDSNAIIEKTTNTLIAGCKTTVIPISLKKIAGSAFALCTSLTSLTIPDSVTSIGSYAFEGCRNLTSIVLGENITTIEAGTFRNCSGLENLKIGNNVTKIGGNAFYNCQSLIDIEIPKSISSIASNAFQGCSGLATITVNDENEVYEDRDSNAIIEKTANTLIVGCKNTIIQYGIETIGDYSFYDRSGLTSITIPDSVTSIGERAFYGCSNLTGITIPNSVTSIGNFAFYSCTKLTSVTLPSGLKQISVESFRNCWELASIYIPKEIESIGRNAFSGCSKLERIIIESETIANELSSTSTTVCGGILIKATTIYVKTTIVEAGMLNSYVTTNYTVVETITEGDFAGYTKYSK